MKKLLFVIPVALMACKKEEPQTTGCNCYKYYESLNQGVWSPQYETAPEAKPCTVDGELVYESAVSRYTWVCQ